MGQKIAVPTKECGGVDITHNGVPVASYNARGGIIEVENRGHADAVRRTVGAGGRVFGFHDSTAPFHECADCGRSWFACFGNICQHCKKEAA